MPNYGYVGVDRSGRNIAGKMMAVDETELEEKLQGLGLWLVSAKTDRAEERAKARRKGGRAAGGTSRQEMINFCTLMSFQLRVGITMITALQVAAEDCENANFRGVLLEVKQHIESGVQLAEALERFPRVFEPQFVSLIRAGESSSALPETFQELKRYLEWQDAIMADVRQATIYPAVVLAVVVTLVGVLFTFVIPRFVMLLTAVKVALPLPTRIVFGLSDAIKATWWLWLLIFTVVPAGIAIGKHYSPKFAILFDKLKFKIPLFGGLIHMLVISRFAHNLGILYSSGVSIVNALKLTRGLVGSIWVSTVLEDIVARVEAGDALSEGLRRYPVFPPLLIRMVVMGENTGNLDKALGNVSEYYNVIVPRKIKKIFAIMEPMLIVFLVGLVGFVALAIFLPILSLLGSIK
jgi:type IV pilus assembly protein PilC